MELEYYFDPLDIKVSIDQMQMNPEAQFFHVHKHTTKDGLPNYYNADIAIVGVPEERNAVYTNAQHAPDAIRKQLYRLFKPVPETQIVDLGNLKLGTTPNDTYYALRDVVVELVSNKTIPIILGGSQDLSYAVYLAYGKLEQPLDMVTADPKFDFGDAEQNFNSESYISKIIFDEGKFAFNYCSLAYQSYFVSREDVNLMHQLYFDTIRLGDVVSNLAEIEPVLRDADFFGVDISSVRYSDAPGQKLNSPNGLFGNQICQLARYAGIADKLQIFGVFEYIPEKDHQQTTAMLIAQIVWHFVQGFYHRKNDYPAQKIEAYTQFIVEMDKIKQKLIFYKSEKSDRWWVEVPTGEKFGPKNKIVACSYNDYQQACRQEIPERWWNVYQKLS